ncbi:hypothetical protein HF086_002285 [Spodoptera exigua]|uniref:dCMP deaminase n=1 Tax=Spodoptera exigua TaxID=7107 RepID=A0A922SMF4_SPOEX|nr:hypothetical protein HF086_002285 [Spodoptera exigua]
MDINTLTAEMSLEESPRPPKSAKREGYLKWEDYFMGTALLAAKRSKDPNCQVGACIVNRENRIVGIGCLLIKFNCNVSVCHAEMNAILNRNIIDLKGCTLYVSRFPCNECAKMIIQSGITKVYYIYDKSPNKDVYIASKKMLEEAYVQFEVFKSEHKTIVIDLTPPLNTNVS